MGSLLIQLLPLILGAMMMPTSIMLVLSLLSSVHGRVGATAFVGGATVVRLLQGIIFGFIIVTYIARQTSRLETLIISILLLVSGLLMWATAMQQLFAKDESGALIGRWMSLLTVLTPTRAFGLGALLVVTSPRSWLFLLSALGLIGQAELNPPQSIAAYLVYVLGADLLLIAPILIVLWAPEKFDRFSDWLRRNDRKASIVVSALVGGFFLWFGASHLIGVIG